MLVPIKTQTCDEAWKENDDEENAENIMMITMTMVAVVMMIMIMET